MKFPLWDPQAFSRKSVQILNDVRETDRQKKREKMNDTNLPVYVLCCTVIILNFIRAKTASIRRYTIILCANIQEKILPYKL